MRRGFFDVDGGEPGGEFAGVVGVFVLAYAGRQPSKTATAYRPVHEHGERSRQKPSELSKIAADAQINK